MLASPYAPRLAAGVMALVLVLTLLTVVFSDQITAAASEGVTMEYETALFGSDEPMTVNIVIDEDDWSDMLENPLAEEYYRCNAVINGETYYSVGIRTKGNTSLSTIAADSTTDRYSLKLEFDHYVDGGNCCGLDKLILNNNYADATNMKEALVYDMYAFLDADASLCTYAAVYINGEYRGLYLALEAVEDSFLMRNYGVSPGELYKPEGVGMGGSGGGSGADLEYTDSDPDSYSAIWDGEVTDSTEADHARVVTALEHAASGEDLETYLDVDAILRYLAVHTFAVNEDSLTGMMAHNYYLYESDGRLSLIPWDYNLSWGGMSGTSATSVVNSCVDGPFSGTSFFDKLLENEEYLAQYHEYLRLLAEEYDFESFYTRTRAVIDSYVETDPTAFYSYEEYETAADTLHALIPLRQAAVLAQCRGSDERIDAGDLDTSVMGVMNGGGGNGGGGGFPGGGGGGRGGGFPGGSADSSGSSGSSSADASAERTDASGSSDSGSSTMPTPPSDGSFDPSSMPGFSSDGSAPDASSMPTPPSGDFSPGANAGDSADTADGGTDSGSETDDSSGTQDGTRPGKPSGDFSPDDFSGDFQGSSGGSSRSTGLNRDTLVLYGVSALVLAAALTFAALFRRVRR